MADEAKTNKTEGLLTSSQFEELLKRLPKQQSQPSKAQAALGNLLKGSASAASKLISVHGKKLSLEGKIINKHLYMGSALKNLNNPLGITIETPMDLYAVPAPQVMQPSQMRQKLNMFGVTKLRLF